jgi:hypothetical protein
MAWVDVQVTIGGVVMKVAGVGDEAVHEKTGRGWLEWIALLDQQADPGMGHTEMAKMLREEYGLSAWWAQKVTGGYEQERKGRLAHEMPGGFSISRTRTWPFPKGAILEAWLAEGMRAAWLPERVTGVRETTKGKSVWMEWSDGESRVNVRLGGKGKGKTMLTVEHSRIPDADQAESLKALWGKRLAALRKILAR